MHMALAANEPQPHPESALHGWLNALSRLGLGLDAGLMAISLDAPAHLSEAQSAHVLPGIKPAIGPGAH